MFDTILAQEAENPTPRAGLFSGWELPLLICCIAPTVTAAHSAKRVIDNFQRLAEIGGGVGTASIGLYEANRPITIVLVATALLVLAITVVQMAAGSKPIPLPRFAGLAMIAAAGIIPALLLWSAESLSIAVLTGTSTGGVDETAVRLSRLLLASCFSGLAGPLLAAAALVIASRLPEPTTSRGASRAVASSWLVIAIAFGALACAFLFRNASLYQAALTGSLRPDA